MLLEDLTYPKLITTFRLRKQACMMALNAIDDGDFDFLSKIVESGYHL